MLKTYVVVHDLGKGCKTIGRARGVGDDFVFGLVSVEVDSTNEPACQNGTIKGLTLAHRPMGRR
jgi:hypothetical protein